MILELDDEIWRDERAGFVDNACAILDLTS